MILNTLFNTILFNYKAYKKYKFKNEKETKISNIKIFFFNLNKKYKIINYFKNKIEKK